MPAHDHSDTRLSCIDCADPICPQCMVQCAVGNRCPRCAAVPERPELKTGPLTYVKVISCGIAVGVALNMLYQLTHNWWGVQLVLVGFCGYASGMFIHKLSDNKPGKRLAPFVGSAVLLGIFMDIRWLFMIPMALMHGEFTVLLMPILSVITVLLPIIQDS